MSLEITSPITQSTAAVIELLNCLGKSADPLPDKVELTGGAQLTRSSKGDVYYFTSEKACTCTGFYYRKTCKHIKALANTKSHPRNIAQVLEEHDNNLHKMPVNYQRMVKVVREEAASEPLELLLKKPFKPVLE